MLGVEPNQADDLASLQSVIDSGHIFALLDFYDEQAHARKVDLQQCFLDITTGARTPEVCIAEIDKRAAEPVVAQAQQAPQVLATAQTGFTILETSCYIADAYRAAAEADIGLITNNDAYRGNLMRIFPGDLTPGFVAVLKPRSFANDSTLVKVAMTGQQLLDALNHPVGNGSVANCVYAFSGLKCKLAPWLPLGEKYLSVALADGTQLDPEQLYSVACWDGTIAEEYITEVLETYAETWEELMTAKLQTDGTVAPAKDGRLQLVWKTQ